MKLLMVAAIFAICGLAHRAAAETQLWLAPLSNVTQNGTGEADFMQLVTDQPAWTLVASRTTVFKLYPFFVGRATDDDLKRIIDLMRQRGIALALEARALAATRGCRMRHGDGGQVTIHLLRRIKALGGNVSYLAMDEPLKHALTGDPACRASIGGAARDVAARIREFRTVFPHLAVGDIEPIGTWSNAPTLLADTLAWVRAYQAATGENLAFLHADVGWSTDWLGICTTLQRRLAALHVPFGMIYNGTDLAPSAAIWADQARQHFRAFEASAHPPDMAIVQSWVRFPKRVLPETDPATLTGVAAAYIAYRHLPPR